MIQKLLSQILFLLDKMFIMSWENLTLFTLGNQKGLNSPAQQAFPYEPNEVSGREKEFSHSLVPFALALFSARPECENSFSRPDISFGLYGNACYAGKVELPDADHDDVSIRIQLIQRNGFKARQMSKEQTKMPRFRLEGP